MTAAFDLLVARARAVPIETEIERRGIKLRGRADRCGPCPKCGGDDRFSINVAKRLFNCRGCGVGGDVITLVQHIDGVNFITACETLEGTRARPEWIFEQTPTAAEHDYVREQRRKAAWLWSQRRPIVGTLAERYLRNARGIMCPLPATLGFLPSLRPGRHPAPIAAFGMAGSP
jgi:putative DNA primase/helicase